VFVAAPVVASLPMRELLAHRRHRALTCACMLAAVVFVLEVPFLADMLMQGAKRTSPSVVVANVAYTYEHPELLRPAAAFYALATACQVILLAPWSFAWFGTVFIVCGVVTAFRLRHDISLVCVTVIPLLATVAAFSFWQRPFDNYWFFTMAPSAALTIGLALTAWRPAAPVVSTVLVLLVMAAQPSRFAYAKTIHHLPEYGRLVRGSEEIRRRVPEIRRIETEFALPPTTDPYFIYEILGGRVTPSATYAATIETTGRVHFTRVADGS
jgi:hypothetical protein